ncbi:putative lipoprotein [Polaromonas sp. OV174]|uniref:YbaY family lipoprotein n=1 Tax=Polaromonas sp. OV174 TaxID=1855300 RepID=UPI0008E593FA|nr:YbaY family lipoprotein [Polaromonas sp. OV174]SFB84742.1 putative lipoprotein [Polaromonas sp. OV174]
MKRRVLNGALIAMVGLLAACAAPSGSSGNAGKPAVAATLRVSGTVSYLQRMALGPDAEIIVQLLDVSRADARAMVLAEQRFSQRQVPVAFDLQVEAGKIDPRMRYSVSARILQGGKLIFISDTAYPVLTQGNPNHVDMVLRMVAQP